MNTDKCAESKSINVIKGNKKMNKCTFQGPERMFYVPDATIWLQKWVSDTRADPGFLWPEVPLKNSYNLCRVCVNGTWGNKKGARFRAPVKVRKFLLSIGPRHCTGSINPFLGGFGVAFMLHLSAAHHERIDIICDI
jgi:hypothetical protein